MAIIRDRFVAAPNTNADVELQPMPIITGDEAVGTAATSSQHVTSCGDRWWQQIVVRGAGVHRVRALCRVFRLLVFIAIAAVVLSWVCKEDEKASTTPEVVAAPPPSGCTGACYRVVVFDFDKTILTVDVFGELHARRDDLAAGLKEKGMAKQDVVEQWFGGAARVDALRAMLEKLRVHRSTVYICSFSFAPIIRGLLALVGIDFERYFEAPLLGRAEMQREGKAGNDPASKRIALAALLGAGGRNVAARDVLFVDDSQKNLDAVGADVATGFLVRPEGGVDVARLEAALFK